MPGFPVSDTNPPSMMLNSSPKEYPWTTIAIRAAVPPEIRRIGKAGFFKMARVITKTGGINVSRFRLKFDSRAVKML